MSTYLKGKDGSQSNSRLMADIMIISALIMSFIFVWIGYSKPEIDLMKIATAIGVVYGSVGGTAMTFLFFQKWNERKDVNITGTKTETPGETVTQIQTQ